MRFYYVPPIFCNEYDISIPKALVDLFNHSPKDSLVRFEYTYLGRQRHPVCHRFEKRTEAKPVEDLVIPLPDNGYLLRVVLHVEIRNQRQGYGLPARVSHRLDGLQGFACTG